jgi:hypothetical protein
MNRHFVFLLTFLVVIQSLFLACERDLDATLSDNQKNWNSEITVDDASTENSGNHDEESDYVWETSEEIQINLSDNGIAILGSGAASEGNQVTIFSTGTYRLKGTLSDGQVLVNAEDEGVVRLIFDEVEIRNSSNAPVFIASSYKTIIILSDDSENYIEDGEQYVFDNSNEDEPNAAIFSKSDLTIAGEGSLTVKGNYNDGIASKDGLIIGGGMIKVIAEDDGIRGKDYLIVKEGQIRVQAGGDALKSDNSENDTKGYILIENGLLDITSSGDAIQAETDIVISDGEFTITSGENSSSSYYETVSTKGIKAVVDLIIDNGVFRIDAADDALHSNGTLVINDGEFDISTGDDGIHADSLLGINGGNIVINECYEGIESAVIIINSGDINITCSDDGLNVAGGRDESGFIKRPGPGQDHFASSGDYYLFINDGHIAIEAVGDGIDVNGTIEMTGGTVLINGPTSNMNSALDFDVSFQITGGFLLGLGSSGMAQAPGSSSTQYSLLLNFRSGFPGNELLHLQASSGENIFSFMPTKPYQSIAFSSPDLNKGSSYDIYIGGESTGKLNDGLYLDGTYTPGTQYASFTVSNILTQIYIR